MTKVKEKELVSMYGIWIVGPKLCIPEDPPVAIFANETLAVDWAQEYYFGRWVMKGV